MKPNKPDTPADPKVQGMVHDAMLANYPEHARRKALWQFADYKARIDAGFTAAESMDVLKHEMFLNYLRGREEGK